MMPIQCIKAQGGGIVKKFLVLAVVATLLLVGVVIDAFAGEVEKTLSHDLSECARIVKRIADRTGTPTADDIARLKQCAEAIHADRLLLSERQSALAERTAALGGKAADRQDAVSSTLLKKLDDLLSHLDAIGTAITPSDLDSLKQQLDILVPHKSRPLLGALPYRHTNYPPREPALSPVIKPAYKGGDRNVYAADTGATPEAPITKEIADLAQSLQWNPVLIYEWVKNNVETEWYWGSMKGAEETLRQKSGNDADQAALLVALLRSAGFPTRYIKGTIEFFPDIEKAKKLTGLGDSAKIYTFLQKAGIPVKPVIAGGTIANFQIEHIWVESFIPYANYRGAVLDDQGKIWLGLDTSIKPLGYTRANGAGVPADILSTLRDDYLKAVQTVTPLDYLKAKLDASLATTQPDKNWSSLKDSTTLVPNIQKIIPAGLQFPQIAITGEYQALPDDLKHKVAFVATVNGNELFSITLDAHKLSNKKIALRAEPETVEDQNLIDSYGGLDNTPAYLVKLRPVLTLDGERLVVAQDGLPMGAAFTLNIDVITPNGTERVSSSQINGNLSVIGVVSQKAATPAAIAKTDDAEAILHKEAIGYIDRWNKSEDDLAALLGQSVSRPTITIATVGAQLEVTWLMDTPHDIQWKGLFLDAGYKRTETVGRTGGESDFMRLSALEGSFLENRIFEDDLKVDSISTAKLLQQAKVNGASVVSINKTSIDSLLSTLPFDDAIKLDITNAVNQGLTITVPQTETVYQDWTGTGYIKEDPATGESGWMLSGQVAGGMTAWSVDRWDDSADTLMAFYSAIPNDDPASATMIAKISATDQQERTVGKQLDTPLKVMVFDSGGRPVKGASVHFSVRAGGGSFDGSGADSMDVLTDSRGSATVPFTLGKKTASNPAFVKENGKQYSVQVGENIVDAVLLTNGKGISPFSLYGLPGNPHRIVNWTSPRTDVVLAWAGSTHIVVEDENNNPVANVPVVYQALDAYGFESCFSLSDAKPAILINRSNSCFGKIPLYGQCDDPQTSTSETTDAFGSAPVYVMLGDIPGAHYDVKVMVPGGDVPSITLQYSTFAFEKKCKVWDDYDPIIYLYTSGSYISDAFGNNIVAARSGSPIQLDARVYALRENATKKVINGCNTIVGNHTFAVSTDFAASGISFSDADGSNKTEGEPLGNGQFRTSFKTKAGVNNIKIKGTATISHDHTDGSDCSVVRKNSEISSEAAMTVYGVDIVMPSATDLVVTTDGKGYSLYDLVVPFTIAPAEYTARLTTVVLYRNGELFSYSTAEKSGQGKATFLKGFKFESGYSYDIQVILNQGTNAEIKSDKVPLTVIAGQVNVQRTYHMSRFDSTAPSDVETGYTDKYQIVPVNVSEPSVVSVSILDENLQNPVALVPTTSLSAGNYAFEVDYGQIQNAGFSLIRPNYYIKVVSTYGDPLADHETIYSGQMSELSDGKMLGQIMVHDVLIQDGSLNLTRQDFAFTGRGPQLAFTRSYTNLSLAHGYMPLGNGWTHSLDMRLNLVSRQSVGPDGLPEWLKPLKGKIFSASDVQTTQDGWTMVQANGSTFRKYNGVWYSERGRHGTLEEVPATGTTSAGFVFTAKDGTRYLYNNRILNKMTGTVDEMSVSRIEDRNGNIMKFTYDSDLLSKVTDAVGRVCSLSYASHGGTIGDPSRLTGVSCTDGVELAFTYDQHGYLETAKRDARVETYGYEREKGITGGEYNLIKATDANNHSFAYEYYTPADLPLDSWNQKWSVKPLKSQDVVKSVTYPGGAKARFTYDVTTANKRTVNDLRGNDTVYTLNYFGNPLKIEEPADDSGSVRTTGMTWSIDEGKPDNVMTSKTDPLANTTRYEYDSRGNVKKETDPYGKAITTAWNLKYSLPESRTDRNTITRTWQYDSKGNLLYEKDGDQKQTNHTYYATGEIQTTTDPRSKTTSYSYDAWGNQASKSMEASTTRFEHDIRGRRTAMVDPNNNRTEYGYDNLDNPTTTTLPAHGSYTLAGGSSPVRTQVHDPIGNLLSETNHLGLTLAYTYTPRNQVKTITRSSGGAKTFDYDNNGNLVSESDWKGIPIAHGYDKLNRRTSTTSRMSQGTQVIRKLMGYDLNSNLTSETDFEGRTTNHEYDKLNRLTKTIQPALSGQTRGELNYTYYDEADSKTNLKTETDQEGKTTSYEYNGRYLRTKRTNALNGIRTWEYDDADNLVKETDEENHVIRHDYDGQNRLVSDIRIHNGSDIRTDYAYDLAGNRISATDPLGHKTETRYDEWNRPWQVTDPDNYTVTTELDGEGNKVKTIDANNVTRTWTYDPRGLITSSIDGENAETTYTHDLNGNNDGINHANGSVTSIAYDAEDRKTLITEAKSQPEERTTGVVLYDKVGNPLQTRDGNGNITATDYNALNLPVKVTDAKGNSTVSDYYLTGKVKSVTNRRNAVTTTDYDDLWRVTKVTDPLGRTTVTTYDNVGNILTVKDKRGIVTETIYDDLYRPLEKKKAGVRLVTNDYDNDGNLIAETDANGNRTSHTYTRRNLKEKTTFADATTRSFTYDGNGNLKTEADEESVVTTHGYDKENRLIATERAGETTQKSYDTMGDLIAVTHPEGNSRTYTYDLLKRLVTASDVGLTTQYEYDKQGNLTKTTDVRGNVVENSYDELNRKTNHIQHKGTGNLTTLFGYDEEGNQTSETDAKGQVSSYVYDPLNRRTESHYAGLNITTGYDENNNVTSSNVSGAYSDSETNTYDSFDRLKTSTQRGTTVSYGYDNNGNRLSVATPGNSTSYTYDQRNRVKTATANSATTSFDYYPDGKKKTATYPNGAKEDYDYYPTDRVKTVTNSINGATISKFAYTYDRNGNRLTQDETRNTRAIGTSYTYDSLDRMTSYSVTENNATTKTDYTFDGYNRKTETTTKPDNTSTTKTYSYDETDWLTHIIDGTKTITYTYDNNGNTTKKSDSSDPGNDLTFNYDARDTLVKTTKGATLLGAYTYNADGYRIRQLGSDRGDVEYIYDEKAVIEERNGTGLLAHYRYANKLYSLFDGTTNQYYHQDALGSTTDLTDDSGTTKASYFINPWGMIVDSIGNSVNRKVFTGKEIDKNTGLIYFGARYYDPDTARFITEDTYLGKTDEPPSLNKYLYAYSNPTVYIDLEGYYSWKEFRRDTFEAAKKMVDPLGIVRKSAKIGFKGLGYVSKGLEYLEQKVDDNYEKRVVGRGETAKTALAVKATMDKLPLTVIKGLVDTPKNLRDQVNTFVEEPKLENMPVLGPQGKAIGGSYAKAYDNPSVENISEAVGQTAFGLTTALGGVQFARGVGVKGTYRAPKPTPSLIGEPVSGGMVAEAKPVVSVPGDANFIGPVPGGGWRLSSRGQGAHLVEKVNVEGRPDLAHFNTPETPRFYPKGTPESAGQAHVRLHQATKNAGIKLQGGNPSLSDAELLNAYRKAYSSESIQGIVGDLRTPNGKTVVGTDLTASQSFEQLLIWGKKK